MKLENKIVIIVILDARHDDEKKTLKLFERHKNRVFNLAADSSRKADILKVISGILTGLHDSEASHDTMLGAFAKKELLAYAYQLANDEGFLGNRARLAFM